MCSTSTRLRKCGGIPRAAPVAALATCTSGVSSATVRVSGSATVPGCKRFWSDNALSEIQALPHDTPTDVFQLPVLRVDVPVLQPA